jgi:hypothetical protein
MQAFDLLQVRDKSLFQNSKFLRKQIFIHITNGETSIQGAPLAHVVLVKVSFHINLPLSFEGVSNITLLVCTAYSPSIILIGYIPGLIFVILINPIGYKSHHQKRALKA